MTITIKFTALEFSEVMHKLGYYDGIFEALNASSTITIHKDMLLNLHSDVKNYIQLLTDKCFVEDK